MPMHPDAIRAFLAQEKLELKHLQRKGTPMACSECHTTFTRQHMHLMRLDPYIIICSNCLRQKQQQTTLDLRADVELETEREDAQAHIGDEIANNLRAFVSSFKTTKEEKE